MKKKKKKKKHEIFVDKNILQKGLEWDIDIKDMINMELRILQINIK